MKAFLKEIGPKPDSNNSKLNQRGKWSKKIAYCVCQIWIKMKNLKWDLLNDLKKEKSKPNSSWTIMYCTYICRDNKKIFFINFLI